jgi:hypothetical protein
MNNTRNNTALAAIVEQGVTLDQEQGSATAWAYLASHALPPALMLRVLAYPDQRRQQDPGDTEPQPLAGKAADAGWVPQVSRSLSPAWKRRPA